MTAAHVGEQAAVASYLDDPFSSRTTIHGLGSDEVRSALHKHVRQGNLEQAVRAGLELARTDADHEEMLWERLSVLAAEDVGLGEPNAICVTAALRESARSFAVGSYERLELAAQAAGYLATCPKDPTVSELMQVVLQDDLPPTIPAEAIDVHTRRGQLAGKTMREWFQTGTAVGPEVPDRDLSWRKKLASNYGLSPRHLACCAGRRWRVA
jgi:replication-associated recombination protein RarA